MTTVPIINSLAEAKNIRLAELPKRDEPKKILMCDAEHFKVVDIKNAFMEGHVNTVDCAAAKRQWLELKATFEKIGYPVEVVASAAELEDMVFTANQVLLGKNADGAFVVPAQMVYPSRRKEVPYFEDWFKKRNYRLLPLKTKDLFFEGQGDALWHPGRQLLWAGFGHRTDEKVYAELTEILQLPIATLKLVHPSFYHLDTAFSPLDEQSVMVYPQAFEEKGLELIRHYFVNVLEVNDHDANNFACNALAMGKKVVLQKGSNDICDKLRQFGFEPVEVDTSEFMKSGGSVSCLKMPIY